MSINKEPFIKTVEKFSEEELLVIFEAARLALSDAVTYEDLCDAMDINDNIMLDLRDKLQNALVEDGED